VPRAGQAIIGSQITIGFALIRIYYYVWEIYDVFIK